MSSKVDVFEAIVVGLDGSLESDLALDWGCAQAQLEQRPLVLLHATGLPLSARPWSHPRGPLQLATWSGNNLLQSAHERIEGFASNVEVRLDLHGGSPRTALLDASTRAAMVVLGATGAGGATSVLRGSVAGALTKTASCPVIVVRRRPQARYDGLLVGTDGTAVSEPALTFAFRVASSRSWPLTVLHCFWDDTRCTGDLPALAAAGAERHAMLDAVVAPHRLRHPEVKVDLLLSRGFADRRLVAASRDYEMVVLGHHRLPPLDALVWGNVTPLVVRDATSDLAVVPYVTTHTPSTSSRPGADPAARR